MVGIYGFITFFGRARSCLSIEQHDQSKNYKFPFFGFFLLYDLITVSVAYRKVYSFDWCYDWLSSDTELLGVIIGILFGRCKGEKKKNRGKERQEKEKKGEELRF